MVCRTGVDDNNSYCSVEAAEQIAGNCNGLEICNINNRSLLAMSYTTGKELCNIALYDVQSDIHHESSLQAVNNVQIEPGSSSVTGLAFDESNQQLFYSTEAGQCFLRLI